MSLICSNSVFTNSSDQETLTSFQLECSQMFQNVCSEATSTFSILSLMGVGWVGQFAKLSCLNFVSRFSSSQVFRQTSSFIYSAGVEGLFFHGCSTLKQGMLSPLEFAKGSAHSGIILAGCKLSGGIAPQNFILTQLFQCFAIVQINQLCGGILIDPEMGSFEEKMIRAAGTSLPLLFSGQILSSCSVGHRVRLASFDIEIELSKSSPHKSKQTLFNIPGADLVSPEGFRVSSDPLQETKNNESLKTAHLSQSKASRYNGEVNGEREAIARKTSLQDRYENPFYISPSVIKEILDQKKPILRGSVVKDPQRFFSYEYCEEGQDATLFQSDKFASLFYEGIERLYQNNLHRMAEDTGISYYHLCRFVAGELPFRSTVVRKIAQAFKLDEWTLIEAWEADFLKVSDALYPLQPPAGIKTRRLVNLVRLSCLHLGKGSFRSITHKETDARDIRSHDGNLKGAFQGIVPHTTAGLEFIYLFVTASNFATPTTARRIMTESLQELQLSIRQSVKNDFDPMNIPAEDCGLIPCGHDPSLSPQIYLEDLVERGALEIYPTPEEWTARRELHEKFSPVIDALFSTLNVEKAKILRMFHGLGEEPIPPREAGEKLEMTRQNAEQLAARALKELRDSQATLLDPFTHQDLLTKKDLEPPTEDSYSLDKSPFHPPSKNQLSRIRNSRDKRDLRWIGEEFGISSEPLPMWYAAIRNGLIDYVTQPNLFRSWERDFFTHSMEEAVRCIRIFLYLDIQDSSDLRIPRVVRRIFGHREDFYSQILMAFQNYVEDAAYQNILSKKIGDTRKVKKKTSLTSIQTEEDLIKEDKERIRTDFGLDSEGLEAHDLIVRELIDQYQVKVGSREADFLRYRPKEIVRIVRILVYLGNNITSQSRDQVATQVIQWFFPEPRIFRTAYTFFQRLFEPKQPLS